MSAKFRVEIAADVAPSIEAWRDHFVSTVGIAKYRRAAGWAVDEVAKSAVLGIREQFHKHLKSNTPWTQSAIKYQRSTAGGLNAIEQGKADGLFSAVYVMPKQSTYLKYLFGLQDNTRLPGDVGLAQRHILIPWWDNIKLTQGVQPTRYGGVPTGFLARLAREGPGHQGAEAQRHSKPVGRLLRRDHVARPEAPRLRRPAAARRQVREHVRPRARRGMRRIGLIRRKSGADAGPFILTAMPATRLQGLEPCPFRLAHRHRIQQR